MAPTLEVQPEGGTITMGGSQRFDVVVVGAGIMGSCAAYELAKRGQSVLLLEQFDFLHHRGSSHGESRTIRTTYPEPHYTSMVLESSRLWEEAQAEAGYRVHTKTPQLDLGPLDSRALRLAIDSCQSNSVPVRVLDADDVARLFRDTFRLPEGWMGVLTELGGVIKPTKAVAMFQTLAIKRGAVLKDRTEVTGIEKDEAAGGGLLVSTASGDVFSAMKCVVAAGAWMRKLVESVTGRALPITPLHTTISYWKVVGGLEEVFTPEAGFPTFASYTDPFVYGTPSLEYPGLVKIALHAGRECDPDKRSWDTDPDPLKRSLSPWIERLLGGTVEAQRPVLTQACMYSMTPDEDYVVDFAGGEFGEDVVVAGGFSGHGFKMGPVVGRMVADMVGGEGVAGVEMGHFRMGRFADSPKGNAKDYEEAVSSHD